MGPTDLNKVKKSYYRGPQTLVQRQKLATIWYDKNKSTRKVQEGEHRKGRGTLEEYFTRLRGSRTGLKKWKEGIPSFLFKQRLENLDLHAKSVIP